MKKVVFTVKEDVCTANGKDPNATELLAKLRLYGTVEDYDMVIATTKAEYQNALDSIVKQYNAIKEQGLTEEEIKIITAIRAYNEVSAKSYKDRISVLETQLKDACEENEARAKKIMTILGVGSNA